MNKAKIGIVHPKFGRGGSEQRALWALAALKDDHEVALITSGRVDIPALNEYYGTDLDPKEFSIIQVPIPLGLKNATRFSTLRRRLIQRYCQHLSSEFDLMLSGCNLCDFGTKGIQFIAGFSSDEELRELRQGLDLTNQGWYHSGTLLRRIYLGICDWISPPISPEILKNDIVVANSKWTAELMHQKYGIKTQVIYPPVIGNFPKVPYEEREKGFVWLGRIVPVKRVHTVIEILEKVRQKGHNIHLHIIGGIADKRYGQILKKLFHKYQGWIFWEGWLGAERKRELISKHRFGISGRRNEPFGIAVAEEVKGGCIVFVPNGGGQREIVDHPDLIYRDTEDGVRKITAVLTDSGLQEKLHRHLLIQGQKFSVENFQRDVKNIVSKFLEEKYGK